MGTAPHGKKCCSPWPKMANLSMLYVIYSYLLLNKGSTVRSDKISINGGKNLRIKPLTILLIIVILSTISVGSALAYQGSCYGFYYNAAGQYLNTGDGAFNGAIWLSNSGYAATMYWDSYTGQAYSGIVASNPIYASDVINRLGSDNIFYYYGHGSYGTLALESGEPGTGINTIVAYNGARALNSVNMHSRVDLVMLLACQSGYTNASYGNLLTTSINQGADTAVGFTNTLYTPQATYWAEQFWPNIYSQETVGQAASNALTATEAHFGGSPGGLDSIVIDGNQNIILNPARSG